MKNTRLKHMQAAAPLNASRFGMPWGFSACIQLGACFFVLRRAAMFE